MESRRAFVLADGHRYRFHLLAGLHINPQGHAYQI